MRIYKTTNKINGKIYIGQTNKDEDVEYLGSGYILMKAIKKYGKNNFIVEVIERCDCKEKLNEREIFWIAFHDSTNRKKGYNISKGGNGGNLGDEVNRKISKSRKGKVSVRDNNGNGFFVSTDDERYLSGELISVLTGVVAHNKGIKMSEEQKVKMRRPKSKAHKLALSKAKIGKGCKEILCITNRKKYPSLKEAASCLNLTAPNIVAVLKGRAKKTKGFSFKYL